MLECGGLPRGENSESKRKQMQKKCTLQNCDENVPCLSDDNAAV